MENSLEQSHRWYDKVPELKAYIDKLSRKKQEVRNQILVGIKDIIIKEDKNLLDKHIQEFSLKRRWYDKDPFSWMIMNSLTFADDELLRKVLEYLKERL